MNKNSSWEANSFSGSQEISAFSGPRMFGTVFTTARNWPLSWTTCIYFTSSDTKYLRSNLISSFHSCLCFQVVSRLRSPDQNCEKKMAVFWHVVPCSLIDTDRRFRGAYCHQHHCLQTCCREIPKYHKTTKIWFLISAIYATYLVHFIRRNCSH
jgi:hypothetical protein